MTKAKAKAEAVPVGETDTVAALQARIRDMERAGRINLKDAPEVPLTETGEEAQARHRAAQANLNARWGATVPAMYAEASMADLEGMDRRLLTWLTNDSSRTLILAGPVGTGKTHAAYAIGNAAVHRGIWTESWSTTDLLEAMRPGGDPHAAYRARHSDLLLLDDLGASKATDWAIDAMTSLVDHRTRENRRQIVTTNAPYDALVEVWGHRLMDRLAYRMTAVTITGDSRRHAKW